MKRKSARRHKNTNRHKPTTPSIVYIRYTVGFVVFILLFTLAKGMWENAQTSSILGFSTLLADKGNDSDNQENKTSSSGTSNTNSGSSKDESSKTETSNDSSKDIEETKSETRSSEGPENTSTKTETKENETKTEIKTVTEKIMVKTTDKKTKIDVREEGVRVKMEIRDDKVKLKVKIEGENEQELESEALTDINGILTQESKLQIKSPEDGQLVINQNSLKITSYLPLSIDLTTNTLIVTTPAGEKAVTILPEQAIANLIRVGLISQVVVPPALPPESSASPSATEANSSIVELVLVNNEPAFTVKGHSQQRLLGLIPVFIPKTVTVSAESNEVLSTEVSPINQIVDALSI